MTSSPETPVPHVALRLDQSHVVYEHGPDSIRHPGVPVGDTHELDRWESDAYPATTHRVWVHVPAQYDPAQPAALMVFLDGGYYLDPDGDVRGAVVLDNLVHRGDIPVTIGVFVDPGLRDGDPGTSNRDLEYDTFDDRFAGFLVDEVVPRVAGRFPVVRDPEQWGICGGSGGGNGAFTVAWMRPDQFRRVYACLPDFASMPGGNPYPAAIATAEAKPLRLLLQAGHRDLRWNEPALNLLAHTLRVCAALAEAGYDFRLVLGDGGHDANHGGVLLPDALRWLWRDGASSDG